MNKKLVGIGEAANLLGVSKEALRKWDKAGKVVPVKTAGNHRRYKIADIEKLLGELWKYAPFHHAMTQGWQYEDQIYVYGGTGQKSHTVMGTMVFWRKQ